MEIEILSDKCVGCGKCVANCPCGVLNITNDGIHSYAAIENKDLCLGCKRCTRLCPNNAIKVKKSRKDRWAIAKSRLPIIVGGLLIGRLIMAIIFFFFR